jgi:dimethylargininase
VKSWAITRRVADSFPRALSASVPETPIDVRRAGAQHAGYVDLLRSFGVAVETLEPDEAYPDGCFVEDCAVVARGVALVTRPGAPSRQGETAAVQAALARRGLRLETTTAPATIDGGDCMAIGDRIFVGRSARTNEAGVARLRATFEPLGLRVVPVPLGAVLHLKCVVTPLGDDRVLLAEGSLPVETFRGFEVFLVPPAETYAANCLAVNGHAIVAAGFPRAADAVARAGLTVHVLETTEFRKADGSLTCLSVIG